MRVIIAGGRNFDNWSKLKTFCHEILYNAGQRFEFVSGGARGADQLGERYARDCYDTEPTVFKPDYNQYPAKVAPLERNREMAEYARHGILIAFLDVEAEPKMAGSHWRVKGGTTNMIMNALAQEMEVHVFRYSKK